MSLLDDARRIMDVGATYPTEPGPDGDCMVRCLYCDGEDWGTTHKPDCPWLSMPKIVKVLEAAQALADEGITPTNYEDQHGAFCTFCSARMPHEPHADTCRWQALVTALQDDVVPQESEKAPT